MRPERKGWHAAMRRDRRRYGRPVNGGVEVDHYEHRWPRRKLGLDVRLGVPDHRDIAHLLQRVSDSHAEEEVAREDDDTWQGLCGISAGMVGHLCLLTNMVKRSGSRQRCVEPQAATIYYRRWARFWAEPLHNPPSEWSDATWPHPCPPNVSRDRAPGTPGSSS